MKKRQLVSRTRRPTLRPIKRGLTEWTLADRGLHVAAIQAELRSLYGLDFALSMIKLRGYDGPREYWVHNLESITLMSAVAAVTQRIQLFASVVALTMRAASTSISSPAGSPRNISKSGCGRANSFSNGAATTCPNMCRSCAISKRRDARISRAISSR
jgi:hypothetical protein